MVLRKKMSIVQIKIFFCIFAKIKNTKDMHIYKKAVILFCFLFAVVVLADAQVFKGEIIGGFNLTQVDGDRQIGYNKFGAHAGVGVMLPFHFKKNSEKFPWAVSMEILFNQRGARKKNYYYGTNHTQLAGTKFEYLLQLNYVSVPVIFHYTYDEKVGFGIGLAYNRMFSSSEFEYDIPQIYDTLSRLKPNDFTALIDVRLRIWQQLKFGFRFEYSMFSLRTRSFPRTIYKDAETRQQRNNNLTFYLVFMLNEKKADKEKRKEKIEKPYYY